MRSLLALLIAILVSSQASAQKVIAFDCFGTVFDMSGVNKDEVRDYVKQVRSKEWAPIRLPAAWEKIPSHPDSKEGIDLLRTKYTVVTCSNGNLGLLMKMSKNASITWDAIIPLELFKAYKPDPRTYLGVAEVCGVSPNDVMLVTANPDFGDLEGTEAVGMRSIVIRKSEIKTIPELFHYLQRNSK